ncbi:hypothetical protein A3740_17225, partial [Oleiphilus sp. HI0068]
MNQSKAAAIIIGANGGIGSAILKRMQSDRSITTIFALSRNEPQRNESQKTKTEWLQTDAKLSSIQACCKQIADSHIPIRYIVIASGLLHSKELNIKPEKRIEDINYESLHSVFETNTFMPIVWLKELTGLLNKNSATTIAVLSARVGSIKDNRLGGWYSYRASKAALNMLLKNASIEYSRRFPKAKVISFHPGTTDTELSKPYQAGVPEEKLFKTDFVA